LAQKLAFRVINLADFSDLDREIYRKIVKIMQFIEFASALFDDMNAMNLSSAVVATDPDYDLKAHFCFTQ
jgi:hypothetical protein